MYCDYPLDNRGALLVKLKRQKRRNLQISPDQSDISSDTMGEYMDTPGPAFVSVPEEQESSGDEKPVWTFDLATFCTESSEDEADTGIMVSCTHL